MVLQRTVLRVNFSCDRDRKKLLQAVSGIRGVDRVEIDVNKGTLTVTGLADPYEIILRTQKAGRFVEVISVGPPLGPGSGPGPASTGGSGGPGDNNKKPEEKKPDQKPQPQAQSQAQPKAQQQAQAPQASQQSQVPQASQQAQPQAQIQFHAQVPTQAHSQVHNPNPCPVCQHMYMYQPPSWMIPTPNYF